MGILSSRGLSLLGFCLVGDHLYWASSQLEPISTNCLPVWSWASACLEPVSTWLEPVFAWLEPVFAWASAWLDSVFAWASA